MLKKLWSPRRHCWWEHRLAQPRCKNVWHYLLMLGIYITYFIPGYISKRKRYTSVLPWYPGKRGSLPWTLNLRELHTLEWLAQNFLSSPPKPGISLGLQCHLPISDQNQWALVIVSPLWGTVWPSTHHGVDKKLWGALCSCLWGPPRARWRGPGSRRAI